MEAENRRGMVKRPFVPQSANLLHRTNVMVVAINSLELNRSYLILCFHHTAPDEQKIKSLHRWVILWKTFPGSVMSSLATLDFRFNQFQIFPSTNKNFYWLSIGTAKKFLRLQRNYRDFKRKSNTFERLPKYYTKSQWIPDNYKVFQRLLKWVSPWVESLRNWSSKNSDWHLTVERVRRWSNQYKGRSKLQILRRLFLSNLPFFPYVFIHAEVFLGSKLRDYLNREVWSHSGITWGGLKADSIVAWDIDPFS